jgi:hypothetical protein
VFIKSMKAFQGILYLIMSKELGRCSGIFRQDGIYVLEYS